MSVRLIIRERARREMRDAVDWYEAQRAGLGAELTDEIEAVLDRMAQFPHMYPAVRGTLRRALVRRFPYTVFYRVRPDRITVVAVLHTSRDPRHWQSRR